MASTRWLLVQERMILQQEVSARLLAVGDVD